MHYKTFCAANSGDGFTSFFESLTDEKNQKVFYIKGGPGSGKSTLLKRIAAMADNAEMIYCSGDPASLDAVVLPDQNAIIFDATAPHSFEPKYPGIGGNIVDLGEGWNPQKMNKKKIIRLNDQKAEIYKSCYSILEAASKIHVGVFFPLSKQLEHKKITNTGERILKQYALWENHNRQASVTKRFLSAISPDGRITLTDTFQLLSKQIIILEDRWMIGHELLSYIDCKLTENGIDHINCYHPLLGAKTIQHIIIPTANLSIITKDGLFPIEIPEEAITRKITIQSYIDKTFLEEKKNKLVFIKRLMRELLNTACEKLSEARDLHMKIEQEYAYGTDFDSTESLKEKLINNLFNQS